MNNSTGGPAFPTTQYASGISPSRHDQGMTLKDYFAAKALQGLLAGKTGLRDPDLAEYAYELAEAMLKERARS